MKTSAASRLRVVLLAAGGLLTTTLPGLADQLAVIKQKGVMVLGTEARFPPFEFVENGKIVGYTTDLLDRIMVELPGVKLQRLDLPWQGILSGLETRKFDYALSSMTATRERAERYALSLPIADATVGLLKRKGDATLAQRDDIAGKVVGTQAGSGQLKLLRAYAEDLKAQGKSFQIKEYIDYNEAYSDLVAGRLDAVANALPNLLHTAKLRPELFEVIADPIGPRMYFVWAARKGEDSASLAALIDGAIAKLNKSGEMAELQKKWFGFAMPVPADALPPPAL